MYRNNIKRLQYSLEMHHVYMLGLHRYIFDIYNAQYLKLVSNFTVVKISRNLKVTLTSFLVSFI